MPDIFILRLAGVLQAWGGHTFEDFRPSGLFPTRSGLTGLLGACLGVDRNETATLRAVSDGFSYCARLDKSSIHMVRISDYHTIENARKVDGSTNANPVVSRRQYLCDATFTVALALRPSFPFSAERLKEALQAPVYTPFLGRRSCPLTRPLFEKLVVADGLHAALATIHPRAGTLYSEVRDGSENRLVIRDVPGEGCRRFETREVFIHAGEDHDVPEQAQD